MFYPWVRKHRTIKRDQQRYALGDTKAQSVQKSIQYSPSNLTQFLLSYRLMPRLNQSPYSLNRFCFWYAFRLKPRFNRAETLFNRFRFWVHFRLNQPHPVQPILYRLACNGYFERAHISTPSPLSLKCFFHLQTPQDIFWKSTLSSTPLSTFGLPNPQIFEWILQELESWICCTSSSLSPSLVLELWAWWHLEQPLLVCYSWNLSS